MINSLKNTVNTEDRKKLLLNFFSLATLQGANYILPLITLPYLVRVLGVENYGLLAFATAIMAYFNILTDYGFNLTATREISIHRENKEKINEIFSSVMTIKFILMIASFILMTIIVFSFKKFSQNWEIYFLTFGTVIGQVFFPVWFFQGMEKMKYIAYLNINSRLLYTISIFIFIHKQTDLYIVPLITSFGFMITSIWSLILIYKKFDIKFKFQALEILKYYSKETYYIFISNISVSLYTMSTILILGIYTNNIIVGYYSIADKLINTLKQLLVPVSQTLFPYISKQASISKNSALNIIKKLSIILVPLSFLLSLLLFIFAKEILILIFGSKAIHSVLIFKLLVFIPFLVTIDTLFGTLIMLVLKQNKAYSKIIFSAGIANIILLLILIPAFNGVGAAISVLTTELYITTSIIFYIKRNKFNIITEMEM